MEKQDILVNWQTVHISKQVLLNVARCEVLWNKEKGQQNKRDQGYHEKRNWGGNFKYRVSAQFYWEGE